MKDLKNPLLITIAGRAGACPFRLLLYPVRALQDEKINAVRLGAAVLLVAGFMSAKASEILVSNEYKELRMRSLYAIISFNIKSARRGIL